MIRNTFHSDEVHHPSSLRDHIKINTMMIVDSLQNSKHIESLHPLFKKAFDYLKETDFSQVEDGRIETDDPRLSFSITTCRGRDPHDAVLESHERHIDILTPIVGVESIG